MTRMFAAASVVALLFCCIATAPAKDEKASKLYELRIYTTNDGKLDELNERFRNHTNKLFEKHGMELVAYWTPTESSEKLGLDPDNTLVYVLAYPDKEARQESWKGFISDPQWKKAFAESRADGPLVKSVRNCFMQSTDYSPLK